VTDALAAIVKAMGAGEITSDEAVALAGVVELQRKALEMVEIEARLAALEQKVTGT
jgi:hypothetical protein